MRRGTLIFLLCLVGVVIFAVNSVWTLLTLLIVDGRADAISRAELPGPNSNVSEHRKQMIPKILHQTYKNETIPAHWQAARQSCLDLHKDYEYMLWTDKSSREFIATEYPWFLETFDGYNFPIQRADAIRYFVLYHYGGVYLDLDDGCQRRLDPLLTYPAWLRRTLPTGISNDAMGAIPHHPFFLQAIDSLPRYDKSWLLPYITVMSSTGPLFLSIIWRHYNAASTHGHRLEAERVRILFPDEYSKHAWSFFKIHPGSSWHKGDVRLILWMKGHWVFLLVLGFAIAGVVFAGAWWAYGRLFLGRGKGGGPYHSVKKGVFFARRRGFWRRINSQDKISIELEGRHQV